MTLGANIGLVGTGVIGRGWAVVFARAGYRVRLYDLNPRAAPAAFIALRPVLEMLADFGEIPTAAAVLEQIEVVATLEQAVADAEWVQESVAENAGVKAAVIQAVDACAPPSAVLASSSSSLPPSTFLERVPGRARCLVAHPFNPPYLVPLVEVVASRWTDPTIVAKALRFLAGVGQRPVSILKEMHGFVGNRLQAAVVNEAMHLVAEGAVAPQDLDSCLRWGLGLRWALMGPFETMDLNAPGGVAEYASKFGEDYVSLGRSLGVAEGWATGAVAAVTDARRAELPVTGLPARADWRDRMLLRVRRLLAEQGNDIPGRNRAP